MKISTIVAGVVVAGGVVIGVNTLINNNSDIKNVRSKIETKHVDNKETKSNLPIKETSKSNIKQNEIEKETIKNKKEINEIKPVIKSEEKKIKDEKNETKKRIEVDKEKVNPVKSNTESKQPKGELKDKTNEEENEVFECYYCKHATEYDTYGMGSKLAYDHFNDMSDEELRDKVYELPAGTCDVHMQNVKDGLEHTLELLHNSEEQNTTNGGEISNAN